MTPGRAPYPLSTWMADLGDGFAQRNLADVVLPGTHNSMMYWSDPSWSYAGEFENGAFRLVDALRGLSLTEYVVRSTVLNQEEGLDVQLLRGIRALDIRLTYDARRDEVYCSHTFVGAPFRSAAAAMAAFLRGVGRGECLLLHLSRDWETRGTFDAGRFRQMLLEPGGPLRHFTSFLAPAGGRPPTVREARGKVVLVCDEVLAGCFDEGSRFPEAAALRDRWNSEQGAELAVMRQFLELEIREGPPREAAGCGDAAGWGTGWGGFTVVKAAVTPSARSTAYFLLRRGLRLFVPALAACTAAAGALGVRPWLVRFLAFLSALAVAAWVYVATREPVASPTIKENALRCQASALRLLGHRSAVLSADFPSDRFIGGAVEINARRCGISPWWPARG